MDIVFLFFYFLSSGRLVRIKLKLITLSRSRVLCQFNLQLPTHRLNLPIYRAHPSTHTGITQYPIKYPITQSINQSMNQSSIQSTYQSTPNKSTTQSTNRPTNQFIHLQRPIPGTKRALSASRLTQAVAIMGFMAGPVFPPLTALRWISARMPVAITGRCAGSPI